MEQCDEFGEFVVACQSSLLRTAWLLTGNWAQAEDLVQTTLLNVLPRWQKLSSNGNPEAYAHRALVNAYLSWWRRSGRRERSIESIAEPTHGDSGYQTVVMRDQIVCALRALPPRQRGCPAALFARLLRGRYCRVSQHHGRRSQEPGVAWFGRSSCPAFRHLAGAAAMTLDDADFARLLKETDLPALPPSDLADRVRERFIRRRKRRGMMAAGSAAIAIVATVVPLSLVGGRGSTPQPVSAATPLVGSGQCAGTTLTVSTRATRRAADNSLQGQEIYGKQRNPALTVGVGDTVSFTAEGPCADRIGYQGTAPLLAATFQGPVVGHVLILNAVSPGRESVTIYLECADASNGSCRSSSGTPTSLATLPVVVSERTGLASPAVDPWRGQDGTLAAARRIPCGPGPHGSNPAVAQEQHDTNTIPSAGQLTGPSIGRPPNIPAPVAGERDYGDIRFVPPPGGTNPGVCPDFAVQLAKAGPTGSTSSPPVDIRLATFSALDPAHINADGSSTPYFTGVLAWEVVYSVDAACYGPPGRCPSGPIPADGVTVVDAQTGQVLVTEDLSLGSLVQR